MDVIISKVVQSLCLTLAPKKRGDAMREGERDGSPVGGWVGTKEEIGRKVEWRSSVALGKTLPL